MVIEFKEKYGELSDAVIKSINVNYAGFGDLSKRNVQIIVECKNILANYRWERILMSFDDVTKFKLIEEKFTNQIIME
ncbi:MAG: hypothetical protein ACTHJ0_15250 [Flavipsychrobacter sp.]